MVDPGTVVIVPFRPQPEFDRSEHLHTLKRYFQRVLNASTDTVVIVEQTNDGRRFNRGQLLNAGFLFMCRVSGRPRAVCLHDVDLMVRSDHDLYHANVASRPLHIAAQYKRYQGASYLGGILLMDTGHFEACNGFPNMIYGWGGEDDALRNRIRIVGLRSHRADAEVLDMEQFPAPLGLQDKLSLLRSVDAKCPDKRERVAFDRAGGWQRDGLNSCQFDVRKKIEGRLGGEAGIRMFHIHVQLNTKPCQTL